MSFYWYGRERAKKKEIETNVSKAMQEDPNDFSLLDVCQTELHQAIMSVDVVLQQESTQQPENQQQVSFPTRHPFQPFLDDRCGPDSPYYS
jgi:hypothetical protein